MKAQEREKAIELESVVGHESEIDLPRVLANTREELEHEKVAIRELANDLADVADVIEPVLADYARRLRGARMTTVSEIREVRDALVEAKKTLLSPDTEKAIMVGERLVAICKELTALKEDGVLDRLLK